MMKKKGKSCLPCSCPALCTLRSNLPHSKKKKNALKRKKWPIAAPCTPWRLWTPASCSSRCPPPETWAPWAGTSWRCCPRPPCWSPSGRAGTAGIRNCSAGSPPHSPHTLVCKQNSREVNITLVCKQNTRQVNSCLQTKHKRSEYYSCLQTKHKRSEYYSNTSFLTVTLHRISNHLDVENACYVFVCLQFLCFGHDNLYSVYSNFCSKKLLHKVHKYSFMNL